MIYQFHAPPLFWRGGRGVRCFFTTLRLRFTTLRLHSVTAKLISLRTVLPPVATVLNVLNVLKVPIPSHFRLAVNHPRSLSEAEVRSIEAETNHQFHPPPLFRRGGRGVRYTRTKKTCKPFTFGLHVFVIYLLFIMFAALLSC